jgi:hypothetical protein
MINLPDNEYFQVSESRAKWKRKHDRAPGWMMEDEGAVAPGLSGPCVTTPIAPENI